MRHQNILRTLVHGALVAAALPAGTANAASADEPARAQLDEVVVTATKREQTLQEVPVAVTVTSAETLEKAQIRDLADLQTIVPSLRVTTLQTSTQTNFLIRGFGNGANNPGIEGSVGVFIDGVYRSRSAAQIGDFVDVERVEVLRGPQSTLFGQNASAGVISIVTKKPEFEWGGTVEATLGNYDMRAVKARLTGPVTDRIAFSLAGSYNERDGYFENLATGNELNDRDRWDLRGQLLFQPSDTVSVRLMADTSRIEEVCCGVVNLVNGPTGALVRAVGGNLYTGDPFDRKAYLNVEPNNEVDNDGVSMHVDWDHGPWTLTSITAKRNQSAKFTYDTDFTSADLARNINSQDIDTFTQEFRVTYDTGGLVSALAGAYWFDEQVKFDNPIVYGPQFRPYATGLVAASTGSATVLNQLEAALGLPAGTFFRNGQGSEVRTEQDNQSYTLFGQVDWRFTERVTLTTGLAYTNNRKKVSIGQTTTDVFSSLNLVQIGFGSAFSALTGGQPPTPANLAAFPAQAAAADRLSVTACSATSPPPACNSLLGLYPLQFLYPPVPVNAERSDDSKTTYTVRLAFDVNDAMNVYAGVSTGFKATSWNLSRDTRPFPPATPDRSPLGGFPNPYYGRYGTRYAGPEESTVYEIGFKGRWDAFTLNAAIFDQEIKGFQSNTFTGTGFSLNNAGKQSTKGIEIEALWAPNEHWEIALAGTFLDPEYDSFPGGPGPNGPTDLTGTKPAGVHETSLAPAVTYKWTIGAIDAFVRADYLYESDVQVIENVPASVASREVSTLNASVGFAANGWNVLVWGRNINDDEYLLSAFPSVAQAGSYSGYPNQPRTFGVTVQKNF